MAGRNYSQTTIKTLFGEASACAFPGCGDPLVFEDRGAKTVTAQIAHIRSERTNGPRHDPTFTGDVDGEENLLLLCGKHHPPVDRHESLYKVDELLEWKRLQRASSGGGVPVSEADVRYLARLSEDERAVIFSVAKLAQRVTSAAHATNEAIAEVEAGRDRARRLLNTQIPPVWGVDDDGTRHRLPPADLPNVETMEWDRLAREAWLGKRPAMVAALDALREEVAVLRMVGKLGLGSVASAVVLTAEGVVQHASSDSALEVSESALQAAVERLWAAANGEEP